MAALGLGLEQIALGADGGHRGGDNRLPDRVDRRIGNLSKQLLEVVIQQLWSVRQHRQGGVRAHGSDRFHPGLGHGGEQDA